MQQLQCAARRVSLALMPAGQLDHCCLGVPRFNPQRIHQQQVLPAGWAANHNAQPFAASALVCMYAQLWSPTHQRNV
jgi:hypothetical protein